MSFDPQRLAERFTFGRDGVPLISLGLEIVVLADRPVASLRDEYADLYAAFAAPFGEAITWWNDADMADKESAGPRSLRLLPDWLRSDAPKAAGLFGLHLQAGVAADMAAPPQFDFYRYEADPERPRSGMRFVLPLETPLDEVEGIARKIAATFPLAYGFAGLAFIWSAEDDAVSDAFKAWAVPRLSRHPGIGIGDFLLHVLHARSGVMSIGWLTMLGEEAVTRLGGVAALGAALPGIEVHAFEGSGAALVKLGDVPETGDVNRRETLPAYRALGECLRPVRISDELIETINLMVMSGQQKRDWLRRFFGPDERHSDG